MMKIDEDQVAVVAAAEGDVLRHDSIAFDSVNTVPDELLYRQGSRAARPSLFDLMSGTGVDFKQTRDMRKAQLLVDEKHNQKNLFSMFEGVFARCLLNIWGVLMFLRLGWIVGVAGVWYSCLIVFCCMGVTLITTSSLSAICTNGEVAGGGAYFMISRALGPSYGGSIGILFSLANAGAVALHLVGLSETILTIIPDITSDPLWDIRIVSIISLCFLTVITLIGVSWVVKLQLFFLFLLIGSIASYVGGTFMTPDQDLGYTGYSSSTFSENTSARWGIETFASLFAIFFPASTGIMAGANISGDLKNPARAIPVGTFWAVFVSGVTYIVLIFMLAATLVKEADPTAPVGERGGLLENLNIMIEGSIWPPLIIAGIFAAGMSSALAAYVGAPRVLQAVCKDNLFPVLRQFGEGVGANEEPVKAYGLAFVIAVGFILIGELNAIAPYITNFFLISYAMINWAVFYSDIARMPGWRPSFKYYNGYLSLCGTVLCIGLMFFINLITAFATIAGCLGLYLYVETHPPAGVNWGSAEQARSYRSALQATYRLNRVEDHVKTFRPSLLVFPAENKPLNEQIGLFRFYNRFCRVGGGLFVIGNIKEGEILQMDTANGSEETKKHDHEFCSRFKLKYGFIDSVIAPNVAIGRQILLQTSGLGKLRPNIAAFTFPETWRNLSAEAVKDYVTGIQLSFSLDLGVTVARGVKKLDLIVPPTSAAEEMATFRSSNDNDDDDGEGVNMTEINIHPVDEDDDENEENSNSKYDPAEADNRIDIYWITDDGGLTVLLPELLSRHPEWKGSRLRVLTPASRKDTEQFKVLNMMKKFRIDATVVPLPSLTSASPTNKQRTTAKLLGLAQDAKIDPEAKSRAVKYMRLGEIIHEHSSDARLVVSSLPVPYLNTDPSVYLGLLDAVSGFGKKPAQKHQGPPILFIRGSKQVLSFYS